MPHFDRTREVYFRNLARNFCYQVQFEYAGRLNLGKFAYHRVAQPEQRYSYGLVCTYFSNVSDINYATFRKMFFLSSRKCGFLVKTADYMIITVPQVKYISRNNCLHYDVRPLQ